MENKKSISEMIKTKLINNTFFICECCFFRGSFITEKWDRNSDIDILVISSDFEVITYHKRKELTHYALEPINYIIDPICLSNKEYKKIYMERKNKYIREKLVKVI